MSWLIYGFDHPGTHSKQFGPLPRKRWVKHPSDSKRHKKAKACIAPVRKTSNGEIEFKAVQYARWIATRDNIRFCETGHTTVVWAGVDYRGKWDKRIRAVRIGLIEITLPNWDWCPEMTEEHETELALAA